MGACYADRRRRPSGPRPDGERPHVDGADHLASMDRASPMGRTMSRPAAGRRLTAQSLIDRRVVDAHGRKLGHVYDVIAERRGDDLCVTHLLVGARAWIVRFGWANDSSARHIPWGDVADLGPPIRLNRGRS